MSIENHATPPRHQGAVAGVTLPDGTLSPACGLFCLGCQFAGSVWCKAFRDALSNNIQSIENNDPPAGAFRVERIIDPF